jgi:hypothetical protein
VEQVSRLRSLFERLPWWRLVPDTGGRLVVGGRGSSVGMSQPVDVLNNDHVTAARTPDGHIAVVYVPTQRTVTVDLQAIPRGSRAAWIDPVSGARTATPVTSSLTTPGENAGGDSDWLLLLRD